MIEKPKTYDEYYKIKSVKLADNDTRYIVKVHKV